MDDQGRVKILDIEARYWKMNVLDRKYCYEGITAGWIIILQIDSCLIRLILNCWKEAAKHVLLMTVDRGQLVFLAERARQNDCEGTCKMWNNCGNILANTALEG